MRVHLLIVYCCLCAACSDRAASPPQPEQQTNTSEPTVTPEETGDVSRAKLTTGGIPSQYVAHFENKQLVKIDEERKPEGGATLHGEYTFAGARLMQYRGAKVATPAPLDLQFDLRGALQSGSGPDVSDEDVEAVRTRAQLLRSHALAHREISAH